MVKNSTHQLQLGPIFSRGSFFWFAGNSFPGNFSEELAPTVLKVRWVGLSSSNSCQVRLPLRFNSREVGELRDDDGFGTERNHGHGVCFFVSPSKRKGWLVSKSKDGPEIFRMTDMLCYYVFCFFDEREMYIIIIHITNKTRKLKLVGA